MEIVKKYKTKIYNLDAIIAVGYKVYNNGKRQRKFVGICNY